MGGSESGTIRSVKRSASLCLCLCLCICLILLAACTSKEEWTGLAGESVYAQRQESFFWLDFMRKQADELLDPNEGWTRLTKTGTRLGAYPRSKIRFAWTEERPLFLYLSGRPVLNSSRRTERIDIVVNGTLSRRLILDEKKAKSFRIALPPEAVEAGMNELEFLYHSAPSGPRGKRRPSTSLTWRTRGPNRFWANPLTLLEPPA